MRLIRRFPFRGLTSHSGFAATIGNFDGVHLGHQSLIKELNKKAKELKIPSLVITFEPHPQEYFVGQAASARLTTFREKMLLLKAAGVKAVLCLPFNEALSLLAPDQFIKNILVDRLKIKYLLVGNDFRFGCQRKGDFSLLEKKSAVYGYQVEEAETVLREEKRVGSTWIRKLLAEGNLKTAEALLGKPYFITGRISHGDKHGGQLGFPTANIRLKKRRSPLWGVFVVRVSLSEEGVLHYGVANLGTRPTLGGQTALLEVHLFDFNQVLYGKCLRVEFLHKLRDEHQFDSVEALTHQIRKDVEDARRFIRLAGLS